MVDGAQLVCGEEGESVGNRRPNPLSGSTPPSATAAALLESLDILLNEACFRAGASSRKGGVVLGVLLAWLLEGRECGNGQLVARTSGRAIEWRADSWSASTFAEALRVEETVQLLGAAYIDALAYRLGMAGYVANTVLAGLLPGVVRLLGAYRDDPSAMDALLADEQVRRASAMISFVSDRAQYTDRVVGAGIPRIRSAWREAALSVGRTVRSWLPLARG